MAKSKNKNILLTGGHAATTALATTEEILRRKSDDWNIHWIGSKTAVEGTEVETLESRVLPEMGVNFQAITAGRLQRRFSLWTIPSLLKIPVGFVEAFIALRRIKPDVILSFGGFAAFPVVVWGFFFGIPVILHEQTSAAGRANRVSSAFAKKIAISRESSVKYFPKDKLEIVGNPVMTQVREVEPKKTPGNPPTVFVTGGSRGSRVVNNLVEGGLDKLLEKFKVIHQTGEVDFEKFKKKKEKLDEKRAENYEVYATIDPMQIDGVYKRADIVVARAGANTVSELLCVKRPSILIPIPWAYEDEQRKNAMYAKRYGLATILDENSATSEDLYERLLHTLDNWKGIVKEVEGKKSPDIDAAEKLVDILEGYVK